MKILVTGGAGFIGSHLIDALLAGGHEIVCLDDLSLGRMENISHLDGRAGFEFIKQDVLDAGATGSVMRSRGIQTVFHMAANSDIQKGGESPAVDLEKTFLTTYRVLDAMRLNGVHDIVFASSSAVYGDLGKPLTEDSGPLFPVSNYGAAKLASEAFITSFCENYGLRSWICRFPNVIGERSTHGAIHDFIGRLRQDASKLRILGDGKQCKPYLYVKDLVDAMLHVWNNSSSQVNCFNLGVEDAISVRKMAEIVVQEMGLRDVIFDYTGGSRGWVGDVPKFEYSLEKIHELGWRAIRSSEEAVRLAVRSSLGIEKSTVRPAGRG
ncbi:MAG: epimerase [Bdellovibrionales bacterium RIFOXYD1_FULL_53_11]|nr:MAG: epimerase [Bdellovibrionales bacterium RIFOXYD1_FULL_53_11]